MWIIIDEGLSEQVSRIQCYVSCNLLHTRSIVSADVIWTFVLDISAVHIQRGRHSSVAGLCFVWHFIYKIANSNQVRQKLQSTMGGHWKSFYILFVGLLKCHFIKSVFEIRDNILSTDSMNQIKLKKYPLKICPQNFLKIILHQIPAICLSLFCYPLFHCLSGSEHIRDVNYI